MKVLLGFIAMVFLAHHFLKEDSIGASSAAAHADIDFPSWFKPDDWDAQERAARLNACREIVVDMDDAIANPPTVM